MALLRLDEEADADARFAQAIDDWRERVVQARRIQTAFGRALLALFGHDAGGMRRMGQRDRQHFLGRRHFEIERQVGRFLNAFEIVVADMPAILAQMGGDPVAADAGHDLSRAHRIGMIAAARIADGRDVIDVHAEAQGWSRASSQARLPGLVTGMAASSGGTSSSA